MRLVNLCALPLPCLPPSGGWHILPAPEPPRRRCKVRPRLTLVEHCPLGLPIYRHDVECLLGLPAPADGVLYVATALAARFAAEVLGRLDVLAPNAFDAEFLPARGGRKQLAARSFLTFAPAVAPGLRYAISPLSFEALKALATPLDLS